MKNNGSSICYVKGLIRMIGLSALFCVAGYHSMGMAATVGQIPEDKSVVKFDSKMGAVTFNHQAHSDMTITECSTCHHTYTGEVAIKPCGDCHIKKSKTAPSKMKAFHLRCQGCHQYTVESGYPAGPLKKECKLCHIK